MKRKRPLDKNKKKNKKTLNFWTIPELWKGETVFVVGGGPSLMGFDFDQLRGQRIVAINLAFTKLPFAQFVFFADNRFWDWHEAALMGFKNHVVSTAQNKKVPHPHFHMIKRNHDQSKFFSIEKDIVVGKDSGVQAINLAWHLGAQRIILLGFDMGFKILTDEEKKNRKIKALQVPHITRTAKQRPMPSNENHLAHWYREHPIPSREQNYVTRFLPQYAQVAKIVRENKREIFLGSPSAIDCIEQIDVTQLLQKADNHADSPSLDPRQATLSVGEFYRRVTALGV